MPNKPTKSQSAAARRQLGSTDKLDATAPVQPQSPEKGPPIDDPTNRFQNHNPLPRRDPSGARGHRDERRSGQTKRQKTER